MDRCDVVAIVIANGLQAKPLIGCSVAEVLDQGSTLILSCAGDIEAHVVECPK